MIAWPNRRSASLLLGALCALACLAAADDDPPAPAEKGLTFSHVYTIDLAQGSDCKPAGHAVPQDQAGELQGAPATVAVDGENDVVFKHNIRLQAPKCDCEDLEAFRSLLYRINGLEEEVTYLKGQCSQGCCSQGADTACGGHGTYQHATCGCLCDPGWEGPDCSASSCPDECNDNGRCVDGRCQCHAGYGGHDCSQLLCPNDCNDKGHCVDGRCVCFLGFAGEDCGLRSCPNDCAGNGRCADGACVCEDGFSGADCSRVMGPKGLRLLRALEDSLQVEWDPVRGAEYYVLTYHPKGNQRALQRVKVPNTQSSYLITGLVPGVTYVVQVHAVIKEISSEADRLVASTVVASVDGVRVLGQTEDTIQVDWQNPAAELDHFRLTHSSPEGQEEEEEVPRSQEARTKHTIIGLHPGTEYHITVQAIRGAYEGKASSVTGITELDAPTNLVTREVIEDTITVTWDKVHANVDGYVISYTSADGTTREIPVGADSASYRLTGLRPGVAYTISIWAVKGSRTSRKTSTQAETALDTPTNLVTREVTDDTATVTWDKVRADVDGYVISYTSADGSSREIPVGADSASYRLTGLRPGVVYTVFVWAVKGSRASRKTSTQAETELDAPTNLVIREVSEDTASVTWDKVRADIDNYVLSYTSADGTSEEIPVGAEGASYWLSELRPGVVYTVYIWAVKGSRTSRKTSTEAETDLDAPTNLVTREVTEDTATVTWDMVRADVDGYVISYTSADGSSREIPVGTDSASYRLTGLRPGVVYTVFVWAVKGSRASRKTSTQAETEIDAPSNLKASGIQKDAATVTWKSPLASIDGYILTYRPEDGSGQVVERQLRAGEKSFGLASLDMGKRYVVTLLAYREAKRSRLVQTTFSTVGLAYPFPMDCTQIMTNGNSESGVYTIYINNDRSKPIQVYCDMATDGGGWAVLQRRTSGKLDFMKRWRQYVQGFGDMTDEFWLGLEKIYELTNTPTQYELRVDLKQGTESAYAVYDNFKLAPPKQKYRITVGNYRGNAGDAMTYHQGRPFSTVDSDNDIALGNCALTHRGAWWYKNCHLANLNGKWGDERHSMGVNWEPWKGHLVSLDFTEMKIRPAGAGGPASGRKRRSPADKRRTAPAK
ncbi:tenascin-N [Anguilla anguilla]|uniref:tenascin-N n=1 Tax=Anguilla anguilla TaxID=7936 RepID=UPI0015ADBFBC|nr:tenascin-N [Anguilla anguilla]